MVMKMKIRRRQAIVLALFSLALLFPSAGLGATPQVAAGPTHTVGLRSDGTVVAVGNNHQGRCNVTDWTDIVQVAAGNNHTVGLRSDGTVVPVGFNGAGQCNVSGWTDIVQVAAGDNHTVGLRRDGTVVAVGYNDDGQCNVSGWTDIVQVAAGYAHTVGLRNDGTVVAVGDNPYGMYEVSDWSDIVQVAVGYGHTVGLRNDGTVVAVGNNSSNQCEVSGWTDIVQVAAGASHTVGLRRDGTVYAVGHDSFGQCQVYGWSDIVQVAAGASHTVGLRRNGTVVTAGSYRGDVSGWNLGAYSAPACGPDNLNSCLSEADCAAAGGYWDGGFCRDHPICNSTNPEACTSMTACQAAGGYWYDNQCHAEPEVTPIIGACGAAHRASFSETPTSGLCASGTASTVTGSGPWYWECHGLNGGDNASCYADVIISSGNNQAHPKTPQVPVSYHEPLDPSETQVVVGACHDVIVHPSLKVPAADVGKSATMIMYIYLPSFGFGINVPARGTTVLAAETVIDLLPEGLDFSDVEGYEFYIYYGYALGAEIKFNAYSLIVNSGCEVPNCAEITDKTTCEATEGCVFQVFPSPSCALDCGSYLTEESCNNAFNGNCKWSSTPFGDICTEK